MKKIILPLLAALPLAVYFWPTPRAAETPKPVALVNPSLPGPPAPAPAASPKHSTLPELVHSLAAHLYEPGHDFARRDEALKRQLAHQSEAELSALSADFVGGHLSADEARSALYLLKLAGAPATAALAQIAGSPLRQDLSEESADLERTIRLGALEQLDILSVDTPQAAEALKSLEVDHSLNPYLAVAKLGQAQSKPGKLHRMMEAVLNGQTGNI